MTAPLTCPECDEQIPPDAPRGLCPKCLGSSAAGLLAGASPQPGVSSPPPLRYFGDYELIEEIARGGMGVVYRARQVSLNRPVAVKMILTGQLASEAEVKRFHAEAEAAASLNHPNIVEIYEVGEHDGQQFYSMRLVEGRSLTAEAQRLEVRDQRSAAQLLAKVARAVHYAHQRGVLHRDLKPGNILLDAQEEPYVADFGLAKLIESPGDLTLSGAVLGSPSFMSPEQAAGQARHLTTATDIYSLGAVLYYLLTGRPPFVGVTPIDTVRLLLETEPVPPRKVERQNQLRVERQRSWRRALNFQLKGLSTSAIDRDLETICLKCLEKEPQRRYGSAEALAEDLERWLRHEPIQARPVAPAERLLKWARRKPALAALGGITMLVVAAGVGGIAWQWREAVAARRDATAKLRDAYLAQAHANRLTAEPGRRFRSLEILAKAAAIRPGPDLRDEAIACLGLADVQVGRQWGLDIKLLPTYSLAFDAACERYARAHTNGDVSIHRIQDQQELFRLPGLGERTEATLCFSPDGKFLAEYYGTRTTNYFRVWELPGRRLALQRSNPMRDCALAFAPDSRTVAAGEAGLIHLHELPSGRGSRAIPIDVNPYCISFDPTGRSLAFSGDGSTRAQIVDLDTGQIQRTMKHGAPLTWLAWSPEGRLLACATLDNRIYLWNALTGKTNAVLEGHSGSVVGVIFNRGGDLLLSSSWDSTTRFWDPITRQQLLKLPNDYAKFSPFSPDDQWLGSLGGDEDQAGLWHIAPGRECRQIPHPYLLAASFDPHGRFLVTTSWDGVRLWNLATREMLGQLTQEKSMKVVVHPDGRSLLIGSAIGLERRPLEFIAETGEIQIGPAERLWASEVHDFSLMRDGATLVAAQVNGSEVLVFDLRHPGKPRLLPAQAGVTYVSVSPDGQWVADGSWAGTSVTIRSMSSGQVVKELPVARGIRIGFSPDGRRLAIGSRSDYRIWKTGSWEPVGSLQRNPASDIGARLVHSPDGQTVAVLRGRADGITFLALDSGRELATIDQGYPLCFNADGSQLAAYNEETRRLMIWDLRRVREQLAALKLDWNLPLSRPAGTLSHRMGETSEVVRQ